MDCGNFLFQMPLNCKWRGGGREHLQSTQRMSTVLPAWYSCTPGAAFLDWGSVSWMYMYLQIFYHTESGIQKLPARYASSTTPAAKRQNLSFPRMWTPGSRWAHTGVGLLSRPAISASSWVQSCWYRPCPSWKLWQGKHSQYCGLQTKACNSEPWGCDLH